MRKKIFTIVFAAFILFVLYFSGLLFDIFRVPIVEQGVSTSVKVYPNEKLSTLAQTLHQKKLIRYPGLFQWVVELTNNEYALRFGEYEIKYPMTAWQLLQHITHGTYLVKHRFTIVNGWTFDQVREALLSNTDLDQTLPAQSNQAVLKTLQSPQAHIEGLFYPDTYFFTWGNSDISVLKTAYQKMQALLQKEWENRAANLPYQNMYQALIVASLIEKETSVVSEKPLIASVIMNRLAKKMRLQIDPTVQYGLNKTFGGPITMKDLRTKTPYNTYLMNGLPPTPICIPNQSSIEAALHPATTDYLYYVATGDGGHHFSKSYQEHLIQVKSYRDTLKASASAGK
jgi:UPF0755 protein